MLSNSVDGDDRLLNSQNFVSSKKKSNTKNNFIANSNEDSINDSD